MAACIKRAREARGWTLQQLADAIGKSSRQQVHGWESAARTPAAEALHDLAEALGVSADWLLGLRAPAPPALGRESDRPTVVVAPVRRPRGLRVAARRRTDPDGA